MILKALYDYYGRAGNLAPEGMEYKEIAFLLVLDYDGNFVRFEDRRIDKKSSQRFLVAKSVGRTSKAKANLLWDNASYVFGYCSDKEDSKKEKSLNCWRIFKQKIEEAVSKNPENKALVAVSKFYQQDYDSMYAQLRSDILWDSIEKDITKNFSFLILGEKEIVAEDRHIISSFKSDKEPSDKTEICLITGEKSSPVETTTATSIPGRQATAKLVAFQVNSGYDSYGKSKGYNAPISAKAEFAYTTALNRLISKSSKNKFYVANRTYLFWASSQSEASKVLTESFCALFGPNITDSTVKKDNPDKNIEFVKETFMRIYSGGTISQRDDKFYILGLAPNSARIAVVYWQELPVKEFARNIVAHFNDMEICDTRPEGKRYPYSGLHSMMSAVTLNGKLSDVQPNLPDAVVKSIIQATPYPAALFYACIRRIRAEQNVSITRMAIIKAYLNRLTNNQNKIKIMLDTNNENQGYLCGRLFAVLEKIQYQANGIDTIRERYLNAASATPAAVFASLLNLSVHHSEKLSQGSKIYYENVKSEIIEKLPSGGFPSHLDINDQGRFFVGYYHQRQQLYSKKTDE